jgi:hypothetical protein
MDRVESRSVHYGSCLCGAVRFEVNGDFQRFYLCHCGHCRKDTGSVHAANLFAFAATLRWIAGENRVTSFTLPSTRHSKSFCATCGAALPRDQLESGLLVVPAGSLDTDVTLKPDAHIFWSSKAQWDDALYEIPVKEGSP